MRLRTAAETPTRRAPVPNGPTVAPFFGGGEDVSQDVGLVRVTVPAGGGMPPHQHAGSDVILTAIVGSVVVSREGGQEITVRTGDAALIGRDETVALSNPGPEEAHLIVAAGPADFVAGIRTWPAADGD